MCTDSVWELPTKQSSVKEDFCMLMTSMRVILNDVCNAYGCDITEFEEEVKDKFTRENLNLKKRFIVLTYCADDVRNNGKRFDTISELIETMIRSEKIVSILVESATYINK